MIAREFMDIPAESDAARRALRAHLARQQQCATQCRAFRLQVDPDEGQQITQRRTQSRRSGQHAVVPMRRCRAEGVSGQQGLRIIETAV